MSQHTPGPWRAEKVEMPQTWDYWEISSDSEIVAEIDNTDRTTEVQEADARLVAAAPELLSSLRVIFDLSRNGSSNVVDVDKRLLSIASECRQAITKAEGAIQSANEQLAQPVETVEGSVAIKTDP
ncbi:MAG TPA: hypothetical protein VKX49_12890 [Bryobacteraceae bacterium]|nr:hypothetical protein [Bryobacteraceae bacterium]